MTTHDGFDRQLAAWLDETAGPAAPNYLEETLSTVATLPQRPSWAFPGRWLPITMSVRWATGARPIVVLALLALVVAAGFVALAVVAGPPRVPQPLPPPFGPARTGLFAIDMDGRIVLADPDGRSTRPLRPSETRQFGATFSRDGTRVAFWQEDGTKDVGGGSAEMAADLWVVDVDGSHARNLTPSLAVAPPPFSPAGTWSPDGSSIAFTGDKDVGMFVVATDGSTPPRAICSTASTSPCLSTQPMTPHPRSWRWSLPSVDPTAGRSGSWVDARRPQSPRSRTTAPGSPSSARGRAHGRATCSSPASTGPASG